MNNKLNTPDRTKVIQINAFFILDFIKTHKRIGAAACEK